MADPSQSQIQGPLISVKASVADARESPTLHMNRLMSDLTAQGVDRPRQCGGDPRIGQRRSIEDGRRRVKATGRQAGNPANVHDKNRLIGHGGDSEETQRPTRLLSGFPFSQLRPLPLH